MGFDVDTAASGREGKLKLRANEYDMVISDMRMENDQAGAAVIAAARLAEYQPAVALLTAYPMAEEDWQEMGADHMLVKPMHTRILLEQIDRLMEAHGAKSLKKVATSTARKAVPSAAMKPAKKATKTIVKKSAAKKAVRQKLLCENVDQEEREEPRQRRPRKSKGLRYAAMAACGP